MQKDVFYFGLFLVGIFFVGWYIIAYSFYDAQLDNQKKNFVSDGCTLIPNGDFGLCCADHDKKYWLGGSSVDRKNADGEFRKCVFEISQNKVLSYGMYSFVRIGGIPYINTPWRWGFGWKFGRGYQ